MDKEFRNKSLASQNIRCAANEWEDPNILKFPWSKKTVDHVNTHDQQKSRKSSPAMNLTED